jgi:uncharacterized protein
MPPRAIPLFAFAAIAGCNVRAPQPRISITDTHLWADGYDTAFLNVAGPAARPKLAIQANAHTLTSAGFHRNSGRWSAELRAGILPGVAHITIEAPGAPPYRTTVTVALATRDSLEDGTPDFLRLDSPRSRASFRRWFTYLAEAQYFQTAGARPVEISDCAALIRYAYREALRAHDGNWAVGAQLPLVPALASPGKYEYPYTPLGANLFRVIPGPFRPADLAGNAFAQFADAKTLWRYNTHFISRDIGRAEAGDIFFYRQSETYHSMIYLGPSQIKPDAATYVVYHTGPDGHGPGEMRRLSSDQLKAFPEPIWRPEPANPNFLGVYRWNILSNETLS